MRNFLIIAMLVVLGTAASGQAGYQTFTQDTTKGAETIYFTSTKSVPYNGFITFDFTCDGNATDSAGIQLQGSNQGVIWNDISGQVTSYKSATATNYQLIANPASYLNYRLKAVGKATDTVVIKNVLFIYKR